ncbi:hypothetical protein GUJ93_ZPchr0009g1946 [Zizania palustris]|uniref:Uncharacterized protein n=1 Tax=Zizania palustris TaxID=103762 RepID=A0A8J5RRC9_ZIZPA|nr:hypothetical protein GUJ93_ZPchr0009g1946 [Zizania palustris]
MGCWKEIPRPTRPAGRPFGLPLAAAAVEQRLQALRQKLGRKQHFEETVADLAATVHGHYVGASPALRDLMYCPVCRVATVLQTRYTSPGFWHAGLNLFIGTEKLVTKSSEKDHLKTLVLRAREHLNEKENEESIPNNSEAAIGCSLVKLINIEELQLFTYVSPIRGICMEIWVWRYADMWSTPHDNILVRQMFLLKNICPYNYKYLYVFAKKMTFFPDTRFLFEGHLMVGPEPPPPGLLPRI